MIHYLKTNKALKKRKLQNVIQNEVKNFQLKKKKKNMILIKKYKNAKTLYLKKTF